MNSLSSLIAVVRYGLFLALLSFIPNDTHAQCADSGAPCKAIRWERGASWNTDGTIDDSPNSGPINGVVRCANSAETQSNIQSTGCYHANDFMIDVSGIDCVDPSTGEIVEVLNPTEDEPLIWLNFDVRAFGNDFETQINDNAGDNIGWALYYNVNPTNGTTQITETGEFLSGDLSCSQASYILIAGGSESSNTWNSLPIPNAEVTSNYYLAIWDQDADGSLSVNNFKARKGCDTSNEPSCDLTLDCPETNGGDFDCIEDIPSADNNLIVVLSSCGDVTITSTESASGSGCLGDPYVLSRTYTVSDDTSTATCTQTFSATDDLAPEFVNAQPEIFGDCDGGSGIPVLDAIDNCSEVSLSFVDSDVSGGCNGSFTRVYTAIDLCGNSASYTQTIYVQDGTAPFFVDCPDDVNYQCGEVVPDADILTAIDACDDDVYVSYFENDLSEPSNSICQLETPGSLADGNSFWAITLPDLPLGISSNFIWDDNGATMSMSGDELLVTGTVVNVDDPNYRFYVHFVANAGVDWEGWNGQLTTVNPFIPRSYKDNAGLAEAGGDLWTTWDFFEVDADNAFLSGEGALAGSYLTLSHAPANYLYGVQVGEAANTKTSDFGMASWFRVNGTILCEEYNGTGDISSSADCNNPTTACAYTILRTWTAVDNAGNYAICEQIVTVGDTEGPVINTPEDITIDCNASTDPLNTGMASVSDNCGTATLSYSDGPMSGDCPITFIRTWSAIDDCENSSVSMQVISLLDDTPPVFDTQPADQVYVCGDEIPAAVELTATDDCSETISYTMTEVIEGNTSTDLACSLTTEAPSPALGSPQVWSMFIQEQGSTVKEYFILDENGGTFTEIPLGGDEYEAHITGTLIRADGNMQEAFLMDIWLIEKTDYDGWTGQLTLGNPAIPRQSKTFNGVAQPGDDLTWDYWILDGTRSELIGINDYAGDILDLQHAPANYLFAFEFGMNANNYSSGLGTGSWFRYAGTLLGEPTQGQGDFAFSADCPPCEYTITRTWTATDACGNSSNVTQVITVNESGMVQDGNHEIRSAINEGFVTAYPNPTAGTATLVYRVQEDTPITLDILSRDGRALHMIYRGTAREGIDNINTFDGSAFTEGMYIIRLTTKENVYYQKLIFNR